MERVLEKMHEAQQERSHLQARQTVVAGMPESNDVPERARTGPGHVGHLPWIFGGLVLGVLLTMLLLQTVLYRHLPGVSAWREYPDTGSGAVADSAALQDATPVQADSLERLAQDVQSLRDEIAALQDRFSSVQARLAAHTGVASQAAVPAMAQQAGAAVSAADIAALPAPASGGGSAPGTADLVDTADDVQLASAQAVTQAQGWVINLAAMPVQADAERMAASALDLGIPASLSQVEIKGNTYWRVQVTGFGSAAQAKAELREIEQKLAIKGAWIMQHSR